MDKVVIVNEKDEVVGVEDIKIALEKELIRRISRILIFNGKGEMFLQKRSKGKIIAPDTWDQSVGGHVDEGESYETAAKRELKEELGIEGINLNKVSKFYFEEPYGKLTAKQFNTLYYAFYDGKIKTNKAELAGGKWMRLSEIEGLIKQKPADFAPALKVCIEDYKKHKKNLLQI